MTGFRGGGRGDGGEAESGGGDAGHEAADALEDHGGGPVLGFGEA
jgi:hypothetical protein